MNNHSQETFGNIASLTPVDIAALKMRPSETRIVDGHEIRFLGRLVGIRTDEVGAPESAASEDKPTPGLPTQATDGVPGHETVPTVPQGEGAEADNVTYVFRRITKKTNDPCGRVCDERDRIWANQPKGLPYYDYAPRVGNQPLRLLKTGTS